MSWLEGESASWPDGEPWGSDFGECYCRYFDDLGLNERDGGYTARVAEGLLSRAEAEQAAAFHRAADGYEEPSAIEEDILRDPEWMTVIEEAATLWHALKRGLVQEAERLEMERLERRYGPIPGQND